MTEAEYMAQTANPTAQAAKLAGQFVNPAAASDQAQQGMLQTALQTAAAVIPAVAAADPRVAAIVGLAPLALDLLQKAMQAQQAGLLPADQLAALFASVGTGIQSTHNAWAQMNAADAARAA
jgi:hypothetical protein